MPLRAPVAMSSFSRMPMIDGDAARPSLTATVIAGSVASEEEAQDESETHRDEHAHERMVTDHVLGLGGGCRRLLASAQGFGLDLPGDIAELVAGSVDHLGGDL